MENPANPDNLMLQAGDAVTIFSQNDIQVPIAKRKVFARIEGEVNVPGVYQMSPGDNLQALIAKAGGPTTNAYLFGTEFYRERVRQEQQINLERVTRRLESQVRSESARSAANQGLAGTPAASAVKLAAEQKAANDALAKLREMKATGRVAFSLAANDENFDKLPVLKLENGDQLIIPSRPDFVHVFGALNQESSIIWRKDLSVENYLAEAGPTSEADLDNTFILRANGSVLSSNGRGWFSSVASSQVMPGDTIVVPERLNKQTTYQQFIVGLKDWATILTGFGLGVAGIKTLRN